MRKTLALLLCLSLVSNEAAALPSLGSSPTSTHPSAAPLFQSEALLLPVVFQISQLVKHGSAATVRRIVAAPEWVHQTWLDKTYLLYQVFHPASPHKAVRAFFHTVGMLPWTGLLLTTAWASQTRSYYSWPVLLLTMITAHVLVEINNAIDFADQQQLTRVSPISRLPNGNALEITDAEGNFNPRGYFPRVVQRAIRGPKPASVLYIDGDKFSSYVREYGDKVVDHIVRELGKAVQSAVRANDLIANPGGEEMTVVLPDTDLPEAEVVAQRILDSVRRVVIHVKLPDGTIKEFGIRASLGIEVIRPEPLLDGTAMLNARVEERIDQAKRSGDNALYEAKEHGRDQYWVASPEDHDASEERPTRPDRKFWDKAERWIAKVKTYFSRSSDEPVWMTAAFSVAIAAIPVSVGAVVFGWISLSVGVLLALPIQETVRRIAQRRALSNELVDKTSLVPWKRFLELDKEDGRLPQLLKWSIFRDQKITAVFMDIDGFKAINDTYGHMAGDQVLREVAAIAKSKFRPGDIAVRYFGKKFLFILPGADEARGAVLAQSILDELRGQKLIVEGHPLSVSATFAVSQAPSRFENSENAAQQTTQWIESANATLEAEKVQQRSRVIIAHTSDLKDSAALTAVPVTSELAASEAGDAEFGAEARNEGPELPTLSIDQKLWWWRVGQLNRIAEEYAVEREPLLIERLLEAARTQPLGVSSHAIKLLEGFAEKYDLSLHARVREIEQLRKINPISRSSNPGRHGIGDLGMIVLTAATVLVILLLTSVVSITHHWFPSTIAVPSVLQFISQSMSASSPVVAAGLFLLGVTAYLAKKRSALKASNHDRERGQILLGASFFMAALSALVYALTLMFHGLGYFAEVHTPVASPSSPLAEAGMAPLGIALLLAQSVRRWSPEFQWSDVFHPSYLWQATGVMVSGFLSWLELPPLHPAHFHSSTTVSDLVSASVGGPFGNIFLLVSRILPNFRSAKAPSVAPVPSQEEDLGWLARTLSKQFENADTIENLHPDDAWFKTIGTEQDPLRPILNDASEALQGLSDRISDNGTSISALQESVIDQAIQVVPRSIMLGVIKFPYAQADEFGKEIGNPAFADWYFDRIVDHLRRDLPEGSRVAVDGDRIFWTATNFIGVSTPLHVARVAADREWPGVRIKNFPFAEASTVWTLREPYHSDSTETDSFYPRSDAALKMLSPHDLYAYQKSWYRHREAERALDQSHIVQWMSAGKRLGNDRVQIASYIEAAASEHFERLEGMLRVAENFKWPYRSWGLTDERLVNDKAMKTIGLWLRDRQTVDANTKEAEFLASFFAGLADHPLIFYFNSQRLDRKLHLPRKNHLLPRADLADLMHEYNRLARTVNSQERNAAVTRFQMVYAEYYAKVLSASVYAYRDPGFDEAYDARRISEVLYANDQGVLEKLGARLGRVQKILSTPLTISEAIILERQHASTIFSNLDAVRERERLAAELRRALSLINTDILVYKTPQGGLVFLKRKADKYQVGMLEFTGIENVLSQLFPDRSDSLRHTLEIKAIQFATVNSRDSLSSILAGVKTTLPSVVSGWFDVTAQHGNRPDKTAVSATVVVQRAPLTLGQIESAVDHGQELMNKAMQRKAISDERGRQGFLAWILSRFQTSAKSEIPSPAVTPRKRDARASA